MAKPIVAIVGRPNVGKSALFNKLIGRRVSIVEDTPGVTRDRIYGETDWNGRRFTLIDTGGIEPRTDNEILAFMRDQAGIAISHADVIVFLTDIRTGLTASDQEVAAMLLRSGKPIVLAVNKMDSTGAPDPDFYEFYNLGLGDPIAVSAVHGHGTGDLRVAVVDGGGAHHAVRPLDALGQVPDDHLDPQLPQVEHRRALPLVGAGDRHPRPVEHLRQGGHGHPADAHQMGPLPRLQIVADIFDFHIHYLI